MTSTVRLAFPSDEESLVDLLRLKHVEDGVGSFDENRVRLTVHRGIARDFAMVGVIRGKERVEASIGLFVGGWWYSSDENLSDLWCFVHPEHRKSTHAKSLIEFAKWAATQLDRPLLMAALANETTARKVQLYERQFGKPAGSIFLLRPRAAEAEAVAP